MRLLHRLDHNGSGKNETGGEDYTVVFINFASMPNTIPEIAFLLKEVEQKYGREVRTSTDFETLSVVIERDINEYLSSSTLKRLWGYVSLKPAPRIATLDVLCRFIGYPSFTAYREALKANPAFESGFFTATCITSAELKAGESVRIGWAPNRLVTLLYEGDDCFTVTQSENAKLQADDRFRATQFLLGYPLFIDHLDRADGPTPSYVAGKTGGLNHLEKLSLTGGKSVE